MQEMEDLELEKTMITHCAAVTACQKRRGALPRAAGRVFEVAMGFAAP